MSGRSPVVHVVAAGEIGGAERMLVDLAQDSTRPHSIALFTPNDELRALFRASKIEIDDRGPVREGPLSYLASTFGASDVRWLASVVARRRAGIVHLHTFASQVLGTRAARQVKARVVRTEHSTRVYDDPSCWPFARWSLPRADAVVFISEHVRRHALAKAPDIFFKKPTPVIHNGVDVARFAESPLPGKARFVALGRLDPRKGLDLALEAIAAVPGASLDIVGDGEERAFLEGLVQGLGIGDRVTFRGYLEDVRPALDGADVVLSSSVREGLGVALLEAMAMGRPVVAVPVGGMVEIVRDGENGWLAETRSVEALRKVIRQALDPAECARRGANARKDVVERFSLEQMRRGYEAVYGK